MAATVRIRTEQGEEALDQDLVGPIDAILRLVGVVAEAADRLADREGQRGGPRELEDVPQQVAPHQPAHREAHGDLDEAGDQPEGRLAHGKRCQQPLDPAICTTIKNRKIRIAVLYTEYDDSALNKTDAWYDTWVHPFNGTSTGSTSTIETNLQSCASPGLYTKVATDGDVTIALQALFLKVASDPRLTQ